MLKAIQLHKWTNPHNQRTITLGVSITGAFVLASSGSMAVPMAIPATIAFYLYENRERIAPDFAGKFFDDFAPICASAEFKEIQSNHADVLRMMESKLKFTKQG